MTDNTTIIVDLKDETAAGVNSALANLERLAKAQNDTNRGSGSTAANILEKRKKFDEESNRVIARRTGAIKQETNALVGQGSELSSLATRWLSVAAAVSVAHKSFTTYAGNQEQLRVIQARSGAVREEIEKLGKTAQQMSTKYGVSMSEAVAATDALREAGYLTVQQARAIAPAIVETARKFGVSSTEMAQSLGEFMTTLNIAPKDAKRALGTISIAANELRLDLGELNRYAPQLGQAMEELGTSGQAGLQRVLATLGMMREGGFGSTTRSARAFMQVMGQIRSGGGVAGALNMNADQWSADLAENLKNGGNNLDLYLDRLQEALDKGVTWNNLAASAEQEKAAKALLKNREKTIALADKLGVSYREASAILNKTAKDPQLAWNQLLQEINAVYDSIGKVMVAADGIKSLNSARDMIHDFNRLLDRLSKMDVPPFVKTIVRALEGMMNGPEGPEKPGTARADYKRVMRQGAYGPEAKAAKDAYDLEKKIAALEADIKRNADPSKRGAGVGGRYSMGSRILRGEVFTSEEKIFESMEQELIDLNKKFDEMRKTSPRPSNSTDLHEEEPDGESNETGKAPADGRTPGQRTLGNQSQDNSVQEWLNRRTAPPPRDERQGSVDLGDGYSMSARRRSRSPVNRAIDRAENYAENYKPSAPGAIDALPLGPGGSSLLKFMKNDSETGHKARSSLRSLLGIEDPKEPAPWQRDPLATYASRQEDDQTRLLSEIRDLLRDDEGGGGEGTGDGTGDGTGSGGGGGTPGSKMSAMAAEGAGSGVGGPATSGGQGQVPQSLGGGGQGQSPMGGQSKTPIVGGQKNSAGYFNPVSATSLGGDVGSDSRSMGKGKHAGVDMMTPLGSPIYATHDGKVENIGRDNFRQPTIRVRNADGSSSTYLHMGNIGVKKGDKVQGGQVIGSSGSAAGVPHLHFERRDAQGNLISARRESNNFAQPDQGGTQTASRSQSDAGPQAAGGTAAGTGQGFTGTASHYQPGVGYKGGGGQTASGAMYDPKSFSAAVPQSMRGAYGGVKYGTKGGYALVQSPDGKSAVVNINDVMGKEMEGSGRVIDLNRGSAEHFGTLKSGLTKGMKVTPLNNFKGSAGPVTPEQASTLLGSGQPAQPAPSAQGLGDASPKMRGVNFDELRNKAEQNKSMPVPPDMGEQLGTGDLDKQMQPKNTSMLDDAELARIQRLRAELSAPINLQASLSPSSQGQFRRTSQWLERDAERGFAGRRENEWNDIGTA